MTQISYTQFDPFNHGTTSIKYKSVSEDVFSKLSDVLHRGWAPIDIRNIEQVWEGVDKASNNYKVQLESGTYILKESHINSPTKQFMVNLCIGYFHKKKIKVPELVPTIDKKSYLNLDHIYCLSEFIDAEHFDGSQYELKQVAGELANLHKVLKDLPYEDEIRELNGEFIIHDRKKLEKIIRTVEKVEPASEFDYYAKELINEIDQNSQSIIENSIQELPCHIIHYDMHPHNLLFDKASKKLRSIIDFDPLRYSQRARDVGFGMHRLSRTYGDQTEKKNDVGTDIRDRAELFLQEYIKHNGLTDQEIKALPWVLQDEALQRVISILDNHYLLNDQTWSFDLPKQVTTLREGAIFEF